LLINLLDDIQGQKTPYPELQVFNRVYYFESQTQGNYENNKGETSRITWDYWDAAHQWNLAIEAWLNRELHVYSTKLVKPEEFSNLEKELITQEDYQTSSSRVWQFLGAWCLVIVGILMMIFG
jgi:hypothetical protein